MPWNTGASAEQSSSGDPIGMDHLTGGGPVAVGGVGVWNSAYSMPRIGFGLIMCAAFGGG